jgi:ribokinase
MKELDLIAVGGCNVDLVAYVEGIPTKDEEVLVHDLRIEPGGSAANVASWVSKLGHRAGFVGIVGQDGFGDFLLNELKGVDTSHVIRCGRSGMVFAVVADGERYLYAYGGGAEEFSPKDLPVKYLQSAKFLHLTSLLSPKGVEVIAKAAEIGKEAGAKVIFDPGHLFIDKGLSALKGILKNTYAFLPSQSEFEKLGSSTPLELGPEVIVVTQGESGCLLITKEMTKKFEAYRHNDIKDTIGAGDAFAGGFISALIEGKSLEEACDFANFIASESLKQPGARKLK